MRMPLIASRAWWHHYRYWGTIPTNRLFRLPRTGGGAGACQVCHGGMLHVVFPIIEPWSSRLTLVVNREWREKRDADVARRSEVSNEKKEGTVKKAREDIDDFYVSYNNKADKFRGQTRADAEQFLNSREDTSAGGTSWERIAKLVDVSGKGSRGGASGSGKERFRELLLDLKKDQNAPGVSGI